MRAASGGGTGRQPASGRRVYPNFLTSDGDGLIRPPVERAGQPEV